MRKLKVAKYTGYLAGYFNLGSRDCPYPVQDESFQNAWLAGNTEGHLDAMDKLPPKTKEEYGIIN
jgi:ribosome modulation factor